LLFFCKKRVLRVQKYIEYFWRLRNWIVGPLSEDKTSGSGLFIGGIEIQRKWIEVWRGNRTGLKNR
jgi:hypothetical protein